MSTLRGLKRTPGPSPISVYPTFIFPRPTPGDAITSRFQLIRMSMPLLLAIASKLSFIMNFVLFDSPLPEQPVENGNTIFQQIKIFKYR